MSFFSTTSSLQQHIFSKENFPSKSSSIFTGNVVSSPDDSDLPDPNYFIDSYNYFNGQFRGYQAEYTHIKLNLEGEEKCRRILELYQKLHLLEDHINDVLYFSGVNWAGPPYNGMPVYVDYYQKYKSLGAAVEKLQRNVAFTYTSGYCGHNYPRLERDILTNVVALQTLTGFMSNNAVPGYSNALSPTLSNSETCAPVTEVPLPVDHVEEILLGLGLFALSLSGAGVIVLAVRTIKCGTIVAEAAGTGARIYSIYGRAAPIIPIASVTARTAILSTSTVAAVTPTIASAVVRGVAPLTVVLALGAATDRLNAQNTGPLKILSEDQTNAVINGLTSADNQRFKDEAEKICTTKRPLCPITPGGSLPQEILDLTDPSFTPTEPGNTCAGSQLPAIPVPFAFKIGDVYKGGFFMDSSPEFLGNDPNQGPPAPGDELGFQSAVFIDELGQDVTSLMKTEKGLLNNEASFDFSDICSQYPPGSTIYGVSRWKFTGRCGPKYMDVMFSYTCDAQNSRTRQVGTPITQTSRPTTSLSTEQLRNLLIQLGILPPISGRPGNPMPLACSGNACVTLGNPVCPNGKYCTAACICQDNVCGDGVKGTGEACDTGLNPSGCNANEQCTNTNGVCSCVPNRRNPKTPGISGAAVTISTSGLTEQWTLRSGRPTDLVTLAYSNNRRETASATMKRTFEPMTVAHIDGTTTTYVYDSTNKLQSLSNTKGFQQTYIYDTRGLLSQIDTRDPELDMSKTTLTPFALPASYPFSNRYEGVRTYETFLFLQKQKPLLMGTFLRPNTHIPRLNVVPLYSTYVITHTTTADGTTDTFTIVANPDTQRYTVSTIDVYTTDFKLQSTTYTVDYTGDGTAERTLIHNYNYNSDGDLTSVTDNNGRIYTPHYSASIPGIDGSESFLRFTDNEGDDVTVRANGIAIF